LSGTASPDTKAICYNHLRRVTGFKPAASCFAKPISEGIQLKEVSFGPNAEEEKRKEARVVCEIIVDAGM